jgi:hypothetical protein
MVDPGAEKGKGLVMVRGVDEVFSEAAEHDLITLGACSVL